jgi:hypothetical protein
MFYARDPEITKRPGGVEFERCYVYDHAPRPAVRFEASTDDLALHEVHGEIVAIGPGTPSAKLGVSLDRVDLKVKAPAN